MVSATTWRCYPPQVLLQGRGLRGVEGSTIAGAEEINPLTLLHYMWVNRCVNLLAPRVRTSQQQQASHNVTRLLPSPDNIRFRYFSNFLALRFVSVFYTAESCVSPPDGGGGGGWALDGKGRGEAIATWLGCVASQLQCCQPVTLSMAADLEILDSIVRANTIFHCCVLCVYVRDADVM